MERQSLNPILETIFAEPETTVQPETTSVLEVNYLLTYGVSSRNREENREVTEYDFQLVEFEVVEINSCAICGKIRCTCWDRKIEQFVVCIGGETVKVQ